MTIATDVATYELNDENNTVFDTGLIGAKVTEALLYFSQRKPWEISEIFYTGVDNLLVDISIIPEDDLIYGYDRRSFHSLYAVEYPLGEYPRKYRNYSIEPDEKTPAIFMELDSAPSANSQVQIRYYKIWTEAALSTGYATLVRKLAAAYCLEVTPSYYMNQFMASKTKFNTLLDSLSKSKNRLNQSINDLMSGRSLIGDERDEAVTAIDLVSGLVTDLISEITSAKAFFNTANVNQPELHYIRAADRQGQAAKLDLDLAKTHVSTFETTAQAWRSQSAAELSNLNASLATFRASAEQIKMWMSAINLSQAYLTRAQQLKAEVLPQINRFSIRRNSKMWSRT